MEEVQRDVWGGFASRRWPGWPSMAAAMSRAGKQAGGRGKGTDLQFLKIPGIILENKDNF